MLTPFQLVCARLLGTPLTITPDELASRLHTEVVRLSMHAGIFHDKPDLYLAYTSGDATTLARVAGFEIPQPPVSLETLNAKLDEILLFLKGLV